MRINLLDSRSDRGNIKGRFRSGGCLHGHTSKSLESLSLIPYDAKRFPLTRSKLQLASEKFLSQYGEPLDFKRAFWRPPLGPRDAYNLEAGQIRDRLEVRNDGPSEVVMMPQYHDPLPLRQLETAWDVLRDRPNDPLGSRRWLDRLFYRFEDGVMRSVADCIFGEPGVVKSIVRITNVLMRLVGSRGLRPAFRLALNRDGGMLYGN